MLSTVLVETRDPLGWLPKFARLVAVTSYLRALCRGLQLVLAIHGFCSLVLILHMHTHTHLSATAPYPGRRARVHQRLPQPPSLCITKLAVWVYLSTTNPTANEREHAQAVSDLIFPLLLNNPTNHFPAPPQTAAVWPRHG